MMNDPATFSKVNVNPVEDTKFFLAKYKNYFKLQQSEDILEVGCAGGRVTREALHPFVHKHLNKLLATDISQKAVATANELYSTENLRFEVLDIQEENVGRKYAEKFHHVFAFYMLHMVHLSERWSKNVFTMLKPKGQFFASLLLGPHPYVEITEDQKAEKNAPWGKFIEKCPDLFNYYEPDPLENIRNILINAGFTIDMIEIQELIAKYTLEELNNTYLSVNHFLKYIPEDMHDDYIDDFLQRIPQKIQRLDDGTCCIPRKILTVIATKP